MGSADPKTKILVVLYYYHPYVSGLSVYAKWIAEGLVREGYEVTVLTSQYDKSLPGEEVVGGVRVIRRPVALQLGKGVIMPTFAADIVRYARLHDYVNIHLPMVEGGLASLFIPKHKLITTYHCDIYLGPRFVDRLITAVAFSSMRLQLERSRAIVTNTLDYLRHSKMARFTDKAVGVYPPVPNPGTVGGSQALFKRLGIGRDEAKIGFVGRIVYEKGLGYLLEAIPHIRKQLPKFKIILMGEYSKVAGGSVKDQLDHYLKLYPDSIVFTGYLDDEDRNRFYAGIDAFVLPSIDPLESFGIVQVEALLGGAPVVASDLPGVREVVRRTGYGRISKVKNAVDIAKQVVEVVKHPKRYRPQHDKVAGYFDPQASIDAYVRLMRP